MDATTIKLMSREEWITLEFSKRKEPTMSERGQADLKAKLALEFVTWKMEQEAKIKTQQEERNRKKEWVKQELKEASLEINKYQSLKDKETDTDIRFTYTQKIKKAQEKIQEYEQLLKDLDAI